MCGIFLGCHATSPLVKVWIPSTGEIAYHKEVEIFDDEMPFVDPSCMPDRQGFSDKDIEALRKPNNARLPGLAHARRQSQPCQRRCTQPMMLHRHLSLTCRHPPRAMATHTSFKRRV